jgi:hypothetical protein
LGFFNKFLLAGVLFVAFCWAAGANSVLDFCADGYGINPNTNECELCPAGFYGPDANNKCSECPAGYYSRSGARVCELCPAGSYSEEPASGSCTKCPKGTYVPLGENENCDSCDDETCQSCGATSSDVCVPCPAGTYGNQKGATSCRKCAAGRYSETVGATSITTCILCPKGTYSEEEGAVNSDTCLDCPFGKYAENPGSDICLDCERQYITEDRSQCLDCPPGNCCYRFQPYVCKKGTWSSGGYGCPRIDNISYSVCDDSGGESLRSGEPMCMLISGFRKGVCEPCPLGWTTESVGAIAVDFCSIRTINEFCGNGGCFSWPDDGSVIESPIDERATGITFTGSLH